MLLQVKVCGIWLVSLKILQADPQILSVRGVILYLSFEQKMYPFINPSTKQYTSNSG